MLDNMERRQIIANNITRYRKEKGITQAELAKAIGVTPSTMTDYMKLRSAPSFGVIQKIADYFNVNKSDIDTSFKLDAPQTTTLTLINETASKLNEDRQENVLAYTEKQLEEQEQHSPINHIEEAPSLYAVNVVEKLSAGLGHTYQEQNQTHTVYTDRDDLKRYDLASAVTGDSMEPRYSNGDIVLIQAGYDNVNGGVYAVDYDGETFLKRVYFEGDRIRLVSFNRDYKDIYIYLPIEDGTYLNIVGKVVDSFTPIQP